jgi:hypothetical protein
LEIAESFLDLRDQLFVCRTRRPQGRERPIVQRLGLSQLFCRNFIDSLV